MALTNFVPEVWASAVLTALDTALTFGSEGVVNRDYEGEVSEYGGSVTINTVADPTIEDYAPYTSMTGGQAATTPQTMYIDQLKAWSLDLDDVDRAQARDDGAFISAVSRRAAHLLAKDADAYVASIMADAVDPGTAITDPSSDDVYGMLLNLRQELSEADVPLEGRWAILPPALVSHLLASQRFTASGDALSAQTRSSGVIGQVAGFTILESNQCPDGPTDGKLVIAGHSIATTFADQVTKVEAVRLADKFVDRMRGLHVYGAKVVRPSALAAREVVFSA